jgi:SAM-dependent methyltransferase
VNARRTVRSGFLPDLARRHRIPERMDDPDVEPAALESGLRFLERANAWTGGAHLLLALIAGEVRRCPGPGRGPLRILDLGTGGADLPRAIAAWARREARPVTVVGLDLHALTLAHARRRSAGDPDVALVRGDALRLPFGRASFDWAISSTFLHHLDDGQVRDCLAEMRRVARRGVLVCDLVRTALSYVAIRMATLVAGGSITRHDGPASVLAAFTPGELAMLARDAGLPEPEVRPRFPFRMSLVSRW